MTTPVTALDDGHHRYLTQKDEMSLADEQSSQTSESDPDTLDVSDDSSAILQGTLQDLRRPLLIAAAVVGTVALVAVALGVLTRTLRRAGS